LRLLAKILIVLALIVLFFDVNNLHDLMNSFDRLITKWEQEFSGDTEEEQPSYLPLNEPENEPFAIATIEPGMNKEMVEAKFGRPQRVTFNEYDTYWHAYHQNYHNFFMVIYDEHENVCGIYTNQNLLSSIYNITIGTDRNTVLKHLGTPLDGIQKGLYFYYLPEDRNYDMFHVQGNYVTFFYDEIGAGTVRAVQIITDKLEQEREEIYKEARGERIEGFEYQLFDLTNAERKKYGLPVLAMNERARQTARAHSIDMARNHYFSHTNLAGKSPFERMDDDGITYSFAGENLAYGQWSAIFAHEGLMNSPGHRENILNKGFEFTGVGVAFNEQNEPYFTQIFYNR